MDLRATSKLLYQLKLANQEMTARFEEATGYSITRYELMLVVIENGPCSQSFIQNQLQIDRAAVTRHLAFLEEQDYVFRKRNANNKREVFVEATELAIKELKKCEIKHAKRKEMPTPLNEEEEHQLLTLLTKMVQ